MQKWVAYVIVYPMIPLGAMNGSGFVIPLSAQALGAILFILVLIWCVYSWIIRYHWKHYGTSKWETAKMSIVYFAGSALILFLLFLAFGAYSLSAA